MKKAIVALGIGVLMGATALSTAHADGHAAKTKAVLETYADIALAKYEDSLATVKALDAAIDALIAAPSEATLKAAKAAWIVAREPYQQTEVYRFGNPLVDEWEGLVNAWPLDEGLIDYVAASYGSENDENPFYAANVIANPAPMINGRSVDAKAITPALLSDTLQEAGGVEANVATGYHAVEFLLWGQDLNGNGAGAGTRPATDFNTANCTGGNCDRRAAYLKAASSLLVSDLETAVGYWTANGPARANVLSDNTVGLTALLTGMGSLSYGELAGERMKLGLLLGDPEEEHDCFADNTHNSHYFNQIGIRNVYHGTYRRLDGSVVSGPSLYDLLVSKDASIAGDLSDKLNATVTAMATMRSRAESIEAYDQMIATGNAEGNAVVQAAIDGLMTQTRSIERAIGILGLKSVGIEGSDSLDNPSAVFE